MIDRSPEHSKLSHCALIAAASRTRISWLREKARFLDPEKACSSIIRFYINFRPYFSDRTPGSNFHTNFVLDLINSFYSCKLFISY